MEVFVQVDKIIKFTRMFFFFTSDGDANDNLLHRTNCQGYQYDVHFIHCQKSIGLHFGNREGV